MVKEKDRMSRGDTVIEEKEGEFNLSMACLATVSVT
jgi:hypothetical protein